MLFSNLVIFLIFFFTFNFNKKNNISLTESNRKKSAEKVRTGKTPFNKKEKEKIDNKTNRKFRRKKK